MRLASERVQLHHQVHGESLFEKDGMPLFTPLGIGSGSHFWGPMERKKQICNDLMERVARDCEPASN